MEYLIKKMHFEELDKAFTLIWNTFLEFVAQYFSKEGIDTFRCDFIENKDFKDNFKNGNQIMYGAHSKEKLVGVVSISTNNHVSCVFIDKDYHRNGIATILFKRIISELKENQVEKISLNASPYALPFYHSIGFKDLDGQQDFHGMLYTPMELML